MISRRGIVSSLLAMPAIIRTPGLLMAIRPLPLGLSEETVAAALRMIRNFQDEAGLLRKMSGKKLVVNPALLPIFFLSGGGELVRVGSGRVWS